MFYLNKLYLLIKIIYKLLGNTYSNKNKLLEYYSSNVNHIVDNVLFLLFYFKN